MKKLIYFVDPNSYHNLQIYDDSLLSEVNRGNEFNLFFFGSDLYTGIDEGKYKLKLIYHYNNKSGVFKALSYIMSQIYLLWSIILNKPAVVHIQWIKMYQLDFLLIQMIKVFSRKTKVIYTAHNLLPHDTGKRYLNFFRKFYHKVDRIIVHNDSSKEDMVKIFNLNPLRIEVIPHGLLSYEKLDISATHFPIVRKPGELVFSMVGKLSNYKGFDLLLDCWLANFSHRTDIRLVLAGGGDLSRYPQIKNMDNISVINRFLKDEEFVCVLRTSDVILLPYREISQSGVLLTVLNERKALLVSNLPALTRPFDFGKIGWIMEDLSQYGLKAAIEKAIFDFQHNFEIPESIWKEVHNYYSWHNIGERTRDLYSNEDF